MSNTIIWKYFVLFDVRKDHPYGVFVRRFTVGGTQQRQKETMRGLFNR